LREIPALFPPVVLFASDVRSVPFRRAGDGFVNSALVRALMAELCADDQALDLLAESLAPRLAAKLEPAHVNEDGWLDAKQAATYLSLSIHALHKHTAARTIPFEQDGSGAKLWFKRSELDAWRRGEWQRPSFRRAA
jgi:hypothetical protein